MIGTTNAFMFFLGATIGKGLNRGLATLAAGALGLGAHHLASLTGKTSEPFLIGLFVFLLGISALEKMQPLKFLIPITH